MAISIRLHGSRRVLEKVTALYCGAFDQMEDSFLVELLIDLTSGLIPIAPPITKLLNFLVRGAFLLVRL